MRVAITNPYCWPEVRRGAERLLEDLAIYLVGRGHQVTIVSTAASARAVSSRPGHVLPSSPGAAARSLFPRRLEWLHAGRLLQPAHAFALQCAGFFRRERFDLVHCLTYHDGFGVALARRLLPREQRPALVTQSMGIPVWRYFRSVPHDGAMFRAAVRASEAFLVLSGFARECMRSEFGRDSEVLPPPVAVETFAAATHGRAAADGAPIFLFVGDADARRKGAAVLVRAFAHMRRELPRARLVFSGRATETRQRQLLALAPTEARPAIAFLGVGSIEDLPRLYAEAAVVALPAMWEAFGLVLVESLAAGTPVVGCRHAGIPDIISDRRVGTLFAPGVREDEADNDVGLSAALLRAYALAREPATAVHCRRHAERFSWTTLGPRYEAIHHRAVEEASA